MKTSPIVLICLGMFGLLFLFIIDLIGGLTMTFRRGWDLSSFFMYGGLIVLVLHGVMDILEDRSQKKENK